MSSVSIDTLERIKQQLKQARDNGSTIKQDLYTHLTEVFNRIMLSHPYDAYDKFEEISLLVKQTNLKIKNPKQDFEVNQIQHQVTNITKTEWINKCKSLLREALDLLPRDEREHISKDNNQFVIPDVIEEARLFEWAGISFGEDETYRLQKSLRRLALLSGASRLRFWGKIFGSQKDYLIVEGILDIAEEEKKNYSQEKRGEGVNKIVFWVTDNLLEDWIQLPDAMPEHIQVAKMIKYIFTGHLNASVNSNPPFPGKERHLLRAQLTRITHATSIIPKGLLEIDEESQKEKYAEEFNFPDDIKSLESWSHQHANILHAGRVSHLPPQNISEEEKDEYLGKLAESDPVLERFKTLNEDGPMPGLETAWLSKVVGDIQPYNQLPPKEGQVSYSVNVLRSLRWPGAITVAQNGKFANIYVGHGLKRGDVSFNPTEPPDVQKDPVDQLEQPEPTPLIAPELEPEPDTDKAKKEEGGEEEDA
ncbi:UNKNOWN [Stylonychia lemnae]|uniref:Uncharacterized protein n=1 Tax=Stylonychia lemnae TaxID=5949 RepID=A0A078AZ95_STYLE|nr:UNKNOWN [Stylonychia lemnae]|eukprot:CDW87426.1 UNKNOWN [Stylonychia lemnae]